MAERLCGLYRKNFSLKISIIRFFSIYGEGLRKQLLWDASNKLCSKEGKAEFWGDGKDIRDWIHVTDACSLIFKVAAMDEMLPVLNGGSGTGHPVSEILQQLKNHLGSNQEIHFKGEQKAGDPSYYVADLSEAQSLGWKPEVSLDDGLSRYAKWFLKEQGT